jgi:uncharacterized protein YqgC (DUF456 family)
MGRMGPWLEIVVALVMVVGLVGVVVPVLPGLLVTWLAVVGWAVLDGGGAVRWFTVLVVGLTAVVAYVVATLVPGKRTADAGAPDWVVLVGLAGMVVGFFVIPVVGAIVGGIAGVWLAELSRTRDPRSAWTVTLATIKGFGIAVAIQFAGGLTMIAQWLIAVGVT